VLMDLGRDRWPSMAGLLGGCNLSWAGSLRSSRIQWGPQGQGAPWAGAGSAGPRGALRGGTPRNRHPKAAAGVAGGAAGFSGRSSFKAGGLSWAPCRQTGFAWPRPALAVHHEPVGTGAKSWRRPKNSKARGARLGGLRGSGGLLTRAAWPEAGGAPGWKTRWLPSCQASDRVGALAPGGALLWARGAYTGPVSGNQWLWDPPSLGANRSTAPPGGSPKPLPRVTHLAKWEQIPSSSNGASLCPVRGRLLVGCGSMVLFGQFPAFWALGQGSFSSPPGGSHPAKRGVSKLLWPGVPGWGLSVVGGEKPVAQIKTVVRRFKGGFSAGLPGPGADSAAGHGMAAGTHSQGRWAYMRSGAAEKTGESFRWRSPATRPKSYPLIPLHPTRNWLARRSLFGPICCGEQNPLTSFRFLLEPSQAGPRPWSRPNPPVGPPAPLPA